MYQPLNNEQTSTLRSLRFWRRNLHVAACHQDVPEILKSRNALAALFDRCDQMQIPFKVQNRVLAAAEENTAFSDLSF
ncbi:hypothetical protein [Planococcus lenghuensis]|uniref:Uncharacterized protein n=1 Tax=Planococcus lenghuensis TaxID=2213202 RepID=A0A1Q2L6Q1_9BACL|nr:hypothetical protein [Planococcus lenghuensis]AQQ55572.1 hypothetical protein B0X71_20580 [Planococcus lenghuensis]